LSPFGARLRPVELANQHFQPKRYLFGVRLISAWCPRSIQASSSSTFNGDSLWKGLSPIGARLRPVQQCNHFLKAKKLIFRKYLVSAWCPRSVQASLPALTYGEALGTGLSPIGARLRPVRSADQ
jgi:hypothetical protein